ncbi:hypothetical protein HDZ31DRAFT_68954, partial [Schizophyllum fasciatum]
MTRKKSQQSALPGPCGNPGVWHGARKAFLEEYLDRFFDYGHKTCKSFSNGVAEEYLKEYPYHLSDSPPDPKEGASEEEIKAAQEAAQNQARAKAMKQVHSWFKNQNTKAAAVKKQPFRDFLRNGLKAIIQRKPTRIEEAKIWMKQDEYRAALSE